MIEQVFGPVEIDAFDPGVQACSGTWSRGREKVGNGIE
jgi:hypothetical protein